MNVEAAKSNFHRIVNSLNEDEQYEFYSWLLRTIKHRVGKRPVARQKSTKLSNGGMDNIEFSHTESHQSLMSNFSKNEIQEEKIDTDYGTITVIIRGDRINPAILTYHDIGLNSVSNFQPFFNFGDMALLMQSFIVFHINAPGQEEGAQALPENYVYPDMDQLAETILAVVNFFGLKHFIGFGVGAGANILSRFALRYPACVDGLFLINPTCTVSSWSEWAFQKLNTTYLRLSGMTAFTQQYLMWHHFGRMNDVRNHELINRYRSYFNSAINPRNLSLFIDAYIKRTDLEIVREININKKATVKNFRCITLLMSSDLSSHLDDSVIMSSRLDPTRSTWMKLRDCGMVLEEEPVKVSEALRYFLQGLGYVLNQFRKKSSLASSTSSLGVAGSEVLYPVEILSSTLRQTSEESTDSPDSVETTVITQHVTV